MIAPIVVLTALGVIAIAYPELLGNGMDTVQLAILGRLAVGLLAALVILKPLVTAACLGSGAPGGSVHADAHLRRSVRRAARARLDAAWPGAPAGSYAIIGGGAILAASMQAPLAAIVLILELAHYTDTLIVPLLLATAGATVVARMIGAPSIYSARLGETALADRDATAAGDEAEARDGANDGGDETKPADRPSTASSR